MKYFHFERLIRKYISSFTLYVVSEGGYDDNGDYTKLNTEQVSCEGAVISLSDSKIYRSNGTLTSKDKILFMLKPIKNDLKGSTVVYEDNVYRIVNCEENFKFTGVYAYTLKYVSAFKDKTSSDNISDVANKTVRLDGVLND